MPPDHIDNSGVLLLDGHVQRGELLLVRQVRDRTCIQQDLQEWNVWNVWNVWVNGTCSAASAIRSLISQHSPEQVWN